jgi:hypothetical protein
MSKQQESPSHHHDRLSETLSFEWAEVPIHASSLAEVERMEIFRNAFLSLLVQDPRVIARLDQWWQSTGLRDAAQVMAATLDEQATRVDEQTMRVGVSTIELATEQLAMMSEEYVTFVRDELHLPYGGVVVALFQELGARALAVIYGDGTPGERSSKVYISDPPAPNFRLRGFRKKAGETEHEIVQRLEENVNAEYARLLELCKVQGHVESGRKRTSEVPRYAHWFYRNRVCGESIRSMTKEHHREKKHRKDFSRCDCRSTVKEAIKQAETLMALAFPPS